MGKQQNLMNARYIVLSLGAWLFAATACGQVPQMLGYQGRIQVGTNQFDGTGQFKFALVNATGSQTYWSNDGTSAAGNQPTAAVSLAVVKGLYGVQLGDAALANMSVLPSGVFANADVRLRVWFNDGVTGFQQFSPDQRIVAVGYAIMAGSVADGAITAAKVAPNTFLQVGGNASGMPLVLGTSDNQPLELNANGGRGLRIEPTASGHTMNVIGGWAGNVVGTGVVGATIAGGGTANYASIPRTNKVEGDFGTIGGGFGNSSALGATVSGGAGNRAGGAVSTISGGDGNEAAGNYATVAGGQLNLAQGNYSLAAGRRAKANHHGAFVWADSANTDFSSSGGDQFSVRASGGARFETAGAGLAVDGAKLFTWQVFPGAALQAAANTGYIVNNPGPANITLPPSPSIGDVVRVTGAGTGGWRIIQNAGQTVVGAHLNYEVNWAVQENSGHWIAVASSADGTKLVAVANGGPIYTSADSGMNWTSDGSSRIWRSVASSADGSKLVAVHLGGQIYTSIDSGTNWTARESSRDWYSVASSADGSKLVAVVSAGRIYTSADSGTNWTARESIRRWYSVASSADGSKLIAAENDNAGQVYTSTDSGVTWTARATKAKWIAVASSADGSKLVAVVPGGQIYTSTDSGVNWTPRENNRDWKSVASSADGAKLIAVVDGGPIYTSIDSGLNWIPRENNKLWTAVASSSDGSKLVAIAYYVQSPTGSTISQIHTLTTPLLYGNTTPGILGYLDGGAQTSIELQYIGDGQFLPLSHQGTITGH
jgi:hypothetical protein